MSLFDRLRGRRGAHWDPAWARFPGELDDHPTDHLIDLGAVEAAPVQALPIRLDIQIAYPPGVDGLPELADREIHDQLRDRVAAEVAQRGGALVGQVTGGGSCRFTAHLPAEPETPVALDGPASPEIHSQYDPQWAYVRDILAPDERQWRIVADARLAQTLEAYGDPLVTPRPVEHVATFADQASAEDAAEQLLREGFDVVVERDGESEFALIASRVDPVAPPDLHELTWWVKERVEGRGGSYGGWRCEIPA